MKDTMHKFVLAIVLFGLSTVGNALGQEADASVEQAKQLAKAFNEIRVSEFVPLEKESNKISNLYYAQSSGQSEIVRQLKEVNEETLGKVRASIVQAKFRIEALQQLEQHLLAIEKDESLKQGFIDAADKKIEAIKAERTTAYKPVNEKRAATYKKHRDDAEAFAEMTKAWFKETGEHELTKDTKRKYHSFDVASGRISSSYYDEHGQKISLRVTLFQADEPKKKFGVFLGKYPITRKDSWGGYTFHVGGSQINVTSRIKEWTQKQMEEAVSDLVDFENLALINPAATEVSK